MLKKLFLLISIFGFFLLPACQQLGKKACCAKKISWFSKSKSCCSRRAASGQANVTAVNKEKIKGEVFFEKAAGKYKVKVTANFKGLKPNQKFGFHVHEFGNCENKALMAGAHFNPRDKKHAGPTDQERHFGDLGNLSSDGKGRASYSVVVKGKVKKFLGRSVIVHALPDDLKSQPTGNSGDRIACGVIVAAMPLVPTEKSKIKTKKPADKSTKISPKKSTDKKIEATPQTAIKSKDTKTETTPTVTADKSTTQKDSSSVSPKAQPVTQQEAQPDTKQVTTPAVKKAITSPATQKVSTPANKTKTEEVKQ